VNGTARQCAREQTHAKFVVDFLLACVCGVAQAYSRSTELF
jgi:hypothetical protein